MTHFYDPAEPFLIRKSSTLQECFKFLNLTEGFPLVVVNDDNSLYGLLSSGDISRYLIDLINIDISVEVSAVCNQTPVVAHVFDSIDSINKLLADPKIRTLPLLDNSRKVTKIATFQPPFISIGNCKITNYSAPFLIAEIGVNHNGNLDEAFYLIDQAASAGCNAVKFQHRSNDVYNSETIDEYDLGTQYIISEINRTNLSIDNLNQCCEFASSLGLQVIITPFNETSFEEIVACNCTFSAIKIASCDLTNILLINYILDKGLDKPLILSTGMSYERDIIKTASFLRENKKEYALLHCNSTYPAPAEDINLSYISRLAELTDTVVGYSSHDGEPSIPMSSICHGASIIEFHITRDKYAKGTDHRASIEVNDLSNFVSNCQLVYKSIGKTSPRIPTQGELANLQSLGKSLAVNKSLPVDHILTRKDLVLVSPGSGFPISEYEYLVGQKLTKDLKSLTLLRKEHISKQGQISYPGLDKALNFLQEKLYVTGIPVRFHDFEKLWPIFQTDMVEFHMSDRDLKLDPSNFLTQKYPSVSLLIHAVEQFEDGFIFDLGSHDVEIVNRSYFEIDRLISSAEKLRDYFKFSSKIPIIVNPGGFTCDKFLDDSESRRKTQLIVHNLNLVSEKYPDYLFIPQTMPPFPWHQGGRSYHNVLTSLDKIQYFIEISELDLCLDLSHTALSSEYFSEVLYDYIKIMRNRIVHIHLSDAMGSNAEGLQVGAGAIDFDKVNNELNLTSKTFMIPEIWQGHLNSGEKFADSITSYASLIK
ncbi:N-acetylneuraminate synthase family protein [bacterium]|nr:N-acetylneuraminate synthase family protein [bacterium]